MKEKSLAASFGNSITAEMSGVLGEFAEVGIDSLMDEGLLKDIPFVSTAVSIYRIGQSVHERHHLLKLISFLNAINAGIGDEVKRKEYRQKFASNEDFRNQELEYVLILTDRYIGFDKPAMLAKLYLAYLDAKIDWNEFLVFSEILDRFLVGDCCTLCKSSTYATQKGIGNESILRLMGLGLLIEDIRHTEVEVSDGTLSFDPLILWNKRIVPIEELHLETNLQIYYTNKQLRIIPHCCE